MCNEKVEILFVRVRVFENVAPMYRSHHKSAPLSGWLFLVESSLDPQLKIDLAGRTITSSYQQLELISEI
jgi:hypothetical protein